MKDKYYYVRMTSIKVTREKLKNITKSLTQHTTVLEEIFNDEELTPENTSEFFEYVRTETEGVFAKLKEWENILLELDQAGETVIHENMIHSTKDNMTALIMHSYYKDVRRRRYMEIKRSCIYVYQSILKGLTNG